MSIGLVASCWPSVTVGNVPTVFCRLGCRVRSCIISIGVYCALYICLLLGTWIIIVIYNRIYILLGKGNVVYYCSCSCVLGFVICRRLSVHAVTIPMPIHYMCEYISRSAISPVWLLFVEAFPWSVYVFGGRSLSSLPCTRGYSGILDFLCLLA